MSASDSTWTGGGIGFDSYLDSSEGPVYFDYVKITHNERPLTSTELSDAKSRLSNSNQYSIIKQKLESEGYSVDLSNATGTYMKVPHQGFEGDCLEVPVSGDGDIRTMDVNSAGQPQVAATGDVDSDTRFWYYSDEATQDGPDNQMIEWTSTEGSEGGA